jgi:hypothetical protein
MRRTFLGRGAPRAGAAGAVGQTMLTGAARAFARPN